MQPECSPECRRQVYRHGHACSVMQKPHAVSDLETPLNEIEASKLLGIDPATLRRWRSAPPAGVVPPIFLKYGTSHAAAVRYLRSDLLTWRAAQRVVPVAVDTGNGT